MQKHVLGEWDLTELVRDPRGPAFERQEGDVLARAKKFQRHRKSLDPSMERKKFRDILDELESIHEKTSIVHGYASLDYSADTQSDKATALLSRAGKMGADVANSLVFFDLWWKKTIDDKNARRLIKESGDLANLLSHKRLVARYSLTEPEERIINTLDVTGASALVKLYDKITNAFLYEVRVRGKKKTMGREELVTLVRGTDAAARESAYRSLLGKYESNRGVLGEIYQNIVLNWRDEGVDIRGYDSPISMRNTANDIDDATISSLLKVCKGNARVFRDFFSLKAKMLGMKKMRRYDLYAPAAKDGEKNYTYDKSVKLVLESLERFSPVLSEYASRVFESRHVDSSVRKGKRGGAFCSTISPGITPYVMLSFDGKSKDVFTLAHELGHAVHSISASKRSILVQEAPLPLAETASTFSELLLYDNLSDSMPDDEKRSMLVEKVDDLYASIMRQSFFTIFEMEAHKLIAGSATVDELSGAYLGGLRGQFGSSVDVSDDFAIEWSCIPHFHHAPFYCYAYSFGNLLALSLFRRFKKEGDDFVPSYLAILSSGGSQKPEKLLAEHGIDISSEKFWQDGFDQIREQVRSLAKLR
ncbi:oligoendopeptidase F [Cenarchaeum symbiosum A]|uniref:Oligoendopeptidase F n=1 Tax=Cenarchaeum symbiosum (strain A) TaxID=414004 RepID=A0RUV1_CENSY|nr:oligoendopeptidase F [Cenarchaeum symbiosum A]